MRIDHVVLAVRDLDEAAERLGREHGLATVPGGVHPGWGTANRVAPLGESYVELLAVVDADVGRGTALGRLLLAASTNGDAWFAVCLADDDIDATAARLGLEVEAGERRRPDGGVLRWRGAGIEDPRRLPGFPFFIAWQGGPGEHPGAATVAQPCGATGVAWVEIAADPVAFDAWTGDAGVPIRLVAGDPGVRRVALATPAGELVL
ncbi:MAG TPA: VOC family protein [Actinomycetota bacterium]|nr:VOC family protein [Actinomycetota bacterium]